MNAFRYNINPDLSIETGLYIVSTPIGNLRDITLRALDVLRSVDIIACEDTRVSLKLLNYYEIKAKLVSYHEHNHVTAGEKILKSISEGQSVALISDAGTPLISDPGFNLVCEAKKRDILVTAIPGASSIMTALVASGMPISEFYFAGFLPVKIKQKQDKLKLLDSKQTTLIFFESPMRLAKTLNEMCAIFGGGRKAAICRELTKKFETYDVASLQSLHSKYSKIEHKLGEIVILVEPAQIVKNYSEEDIVKLAEEYNQLPISKAASIVAKLSGEQKSKVYKILLNNKAL